MIYANDIKYGLGGAESESFENKFLLYPSLLLPPVAVGLLTRHQVNGADGAKFNVKLMAVSRWLATVAFIPGCRKLLVGQRC